MGKDSASLEQRLEAVVDLVTQLATGQLDARLAPSKRADHLDAVILGLNMLAEELSHEQQQRRYAEELLRDEVEAYEDAPALLCSTTPDLRIEKCNRTLAKALCETKDQLLGRYLPDLCDPSCRQDAEQTLRQLEVGTAPVALELHLRRADGSTIVVDTSTRRVRLKSGAERLRVIGRDVTSEKRLEAQLLQAQKMEAVGRLSGGVAHDFNNILSVILNSAAFLRSELEARSLSLHDLEMIEQAAARATSLTNDLLAFSRRRVVEPKPTDIGRCIEEASRMIRRLIGETIQLSTVTHGRSLVVLIDPSQLLQVLINLAINARDAMDTGGNLSIEAKAVKLTGGESSRQLEMPPGEYAMISVTDSGTGMSPEIIRQAFEPFFTTKAAGQGSGLGLSMCYGIVRQAGGQIWIHSEPNKGTVVKIHLPLTSQKSYSEPAGGARESTAGGDETVLLVDDDSAVCQIVARVLTQAGYEVLVADSGAAALETARQFQGKIALLITDVIMPEMDGRELANALQLTRPETRALYLSGYTADVMVEQGVFSPESELLSKPFTAAALRKAVRRVLDRAG